MHIQGGGIDIMDYKYYLYILGVFAVLYFVKRVFKINLNKLDEDKIRENIIRQPKTYFIAMLICSLGGIIMICLMIFLPPEYSVNSFEERIATSLLVSVVFLLPCVLMMVYSLVWKVEIYEDSFMYRNMFGKKRIYNFKGIEIKEMSASVRFYLNGKRILLISPFQPNWDALHLAIKDHRGYYGRIRANQKKKESDEQD